MSKPDKFWMTKARNMLKHMRMNKNNVRYQLNVEYLASKLQKTYADGSNDGWDAGIDKW